MSASKKTSTGASEASTPRASACALLPGSPGGRARTTVAPAREASPAVPSDDPSSTTITRPTPAAPRAARTTPATVGSSSRAGMITSKSGMGRDGSSLLLPRSAPDSPLVQRLVKRNPLADEHDSTFRGYPAQDVRRRACLDRPGQALREPAVDLRRHRGGAEGLRQLRALADTLQQPGDHLAAGVRKHRRVDRWSRRGDGGRQRLREIHRRGGNPPEGFQALQHLLQLGLMERL